jgi:hypothetical protein
MAQEKYASFGGFSRGCHGGLAPADLAKGYFHQAVNVAVRGGQVRTRPRLETRAVLQGIGAFQGAAVYSRDSGDRLVYGRGGRVRVLNLATGDDVEVAQLSSTAPKFFFCQADRYLIVQDRVSRPAILDGGTLLRYAAGYIDAGPNEVYTGGVMAYGHGRIFLSPTFLHTINGAPTDQTGRPYWVAGSILTPSDPENVLLFEETQYLNGGTANALPFENGFVQALHFFQNIASGTGVGPLLVFGKRGVSAVSVNVPRDSWFTADFSQVLYLGPGTVSPRSIAPVNNDLVFRSLDGIRSVRLTAQSASSNSSAPLAVVPMSHEVSHRLSEIGVEDLAEVSGAFADNRYLMTSNRTASGFQSLVSLDTSPVSAFGSSSSPAYDDIWVSVPFLEVLSATAANGLPEHLVVVSRNGNLELAGFSETAIKDFDDAVPTSRVYFPATAGSGSQSLEDMVRFQALHVTLRDVKGPLRIRAYYRADEYPYWARTEEIVWQGGDQDRPYSFPKLVLGPIDPDTGFTGGQGFPYGVGRNVQVCLEWDGVATLSGAVIALSKVPASPESSQGGMLTTCESPPGTAGVVELNDYEVMI